MHWFRVRVLQQQHFTLYDRSVKQTLNTTALHVEPCSFHTGRADANANANLLLSFGRGSVYLSPKWTLVTLPLLSLTHTVFVIIM